MKTGDLIEALAADSGVRPVRLDVAFRAAATIAVITAGVAFMLFLGPREDAAASLATVRFPFKFAVTITLALAAAAAALRLSRPGAPMGYARAALLAAPVLLAGGIALELMVVPHELWAPRLIGRNWAFCLAYVPALSAGPLALLLLALRRGAPSSPALAGAAAGLLAGAIGATFYAAHCIDDSPLFVATWYTLGIGIVTAAGALIGSHLLRW
jgi:hypothetical protein